MAKKKRERAKKREKREKREIREIREIRERERTETRQSFARMNGDFSAIDTIYRCAVLESVGSILTHFYVMSQSPNYGPTGSAIIPLNGSHHPQEVQMRHNQHSSAHGVARPEKVAERKTVVGHAGGEHLQVWFLDADDALEARLRLQLGQYVKVAGQTHYPVEIRKSIGHERPPREEIGIERVVDGRKHVFELWIWYSDVSMEMRVWSISMAPKRQNWPLELMRRGFNVQSESEIAPIGNFGGRHGGLDGVGAH